MSRNNGEWELYRRIVAQLRPYWGYIAAAMLLNLLSTPLVLLMPVPLKLVVDSVIGSRPLPSVLRNFVSHAIAVSPSGLLFFAVGLLVVVTVLIRLQSFAMNLLRTYAGEKMVLALRTRLFAHMQRLSTSYHDAQGTTDSTYRIQYDTTAIQDLAIDGIIPLITSAFTLAGMTYVIFHLDWELALVAIAISPFLYLLSRTYRSRLRSHARTIKRLESSAMSVVQEVLGALRVVKAFGQEDREQERFHFRFSESMRARVRLAFLDGQYGMLIGLCTAVGTAAVLMIGTLHVRAGTLSLGSLLLVMGYLTQFYEPLRTLSKKSARLQSALASVERVFALLDEAPDVPEKPHPRRLTRARGEISFRNVSFGYAQNPPVLQELSFDVSAGTRVGIAGVTGVGKTTLMSLLTRFYDPTSGAILLDGVDLREYALKDLRNQFAIVQQEPVLFSVSIAENIAYARPDAGREEIEQAAAAADAHQFICQLPEGYGTVVGERGMRLSGGERQRISLARAFLKNAPILILDEPTSSVDVKTEATIVEALERLMRDRTTFIVAHRLSTLRHCNRLLYIERGHLVPVTADNILLAAQG